MVESDARRPELLPAAFADFLQLQGRMLRVRLQKRELLIRESLDLGRERLILLPETLRGGMPHGGLERPDPAAPFVVQSLLDGVVEAARREIGLNPSVDWLGMVRVEPGVQTIQLIRAEGGDGALDLFDGAQAHDDPVSTL